MRLFILIGSINMAVAITLGAFGAHSLEKKISEKMLHTWNTAAHYHLIHAIALIIIGLLASTTDGWMIKTSGWIMLAGIILFSGSLYLLVLSNIKALGAITPLGGLSFIIGWVLLAIAAWKFMDR